MCMCVQEPGPEPVEGGVQATPCAYADLLQYNAHQMLQHVPVKPMVLWLDRVYDLRGAPSTVQEQLTGWKKRWGRRAGA